MVKRPIGPNEAAGLRFGIVPTYRCNMSCPNCNRGIDMFPWPEGNELSWRSVKQAGEMVNASGINVNKVRITGGEPTLFQGLKGIVEAVKRYWKPDRLTTVLTNGTTVGTRPKVKARYKAGTKKQEDFDRYKPWMLSPTDLGIDEVNECGYGTDYPCEQQKGCGRLFDPYGFSFCVLASSLGRFLRIDPYSYEVNLHGDPNICRHCLYSVSRKTMWEVWKKWRAGEIEYPSKTFKRAIEWFRDEPFVFSRWRDRR